MLGLLVAILAALALLPIARELWRAGPRWGAAIVLLPLLLALAPTATTPPAPPSNRPLVQPDDGYIGSATCRACHPGEHASWHASYHRTMTQPATRATVAATFEQLDLDYFGEPVRLRWRGDTLWADLVQHHPEPHRVDRPVVQLTGSHHVQVLWYSTGNERELGIVPMVYRIAERRWLPFPAEFLVPPIAKEPPVPGTWNGNCNGCHATNSRPRVDLGKVDTHVGELGIACEACHGPGGEHARVNRDPARRYAHHASDDADPTIVEPRRLPAARAVEVCGQCHSHSLVRLEHFDTWRERGSPFRPGQVLDRSQRLLSPTAPPSPELQRELARDPHFFAGKFWADGTSRVTGRELHGIQQSPCFAGGSSPRSMTCSSCHRMHQRRDDPRPVAEWANAQLDVDMAGDRACLQCHPRFAAKDALVAHTHHDAGSPGSRCYDCHMPHTTYGLLRAMRSHTVSSPDVADELATGRPNACNLCHLDRTLQWTAERLETWYGRGLPALDDEQRTVAAGPRWLLLGDAGLRALVAWNAGYPPAQRAAGTDWLEPYLAQLLADPYIAVRIVSKRSLATIAGVELQGYDELAPADVAASFASSLQARWQQRPRPTGERPELLLAGGALQQERFRRLLARRDDRPVFLSE